MAAASYSSDVLHTFYGSIPRRENVRLPEPLNEVEVEPVLDEFELNQNNFGEWLREWRMNISQVDPNRGQRDMFRDILHEEEKIRESLTAPKKIVITRKDWEDFRKADDCHICNKPLIKEEFMDSLPVWNIEEGTGKFSYWGQGHRKCFYEANYGKEKKWGEQRLKRLTDKKEAESEENCKYCEKPLLQKNFRDAVKEHCHVTGRYRGAAHSYCNNLLRIHPKTEEIPVVFHNLKGYDAHHLMQAVSKTKKR